MRSLLRNGLTQTLAAYALLPKASSAAPTLPSPPHTVDDSRFLRLHLALSGELRSDADVMIGGYKKAGCVRVMFRQM